MSKVYKLALEVLLIMIAVQVRSNHESLFDRWVETTYRDDRGHHQH